MGAGKYFKCPHGIRYIPHYNFLNRWLFRSIYSGIRFLPYVNCWIYHLLPYYASPWELLKSNNVKHYIEALKLEHESVWTFIKFGVELTMIVIPSAVIAWVQILYPMVPKDKQNSLQFFIMQLVVIIQIIYLLIGLWQGILMKLYDFAWGIVRK